MPLRKPKLSLLVDAHMSIISEEDKTISWLTFEPRSGIAENILHLVCIFCMLICTQTVSPKVLEDAFAIVFITYHQMLTSKNFALTLARPPWLSWSDVTRIILCLHEKSNKVDLFSKVACWLISEKIKRWAVVYSALTFFFFVYEKENMRGMWCLLLDTNVDRRASASLKTMKNLVLVYFSHSDLARKTARL